MEPATLLLPAFLAGLATFLAPCTLPMLPAYLGFISGVSAQEAVLVHDRKIRRRIFLSGLSFTLGFSVVFIALGVFAGAIGALFPGFRAAFTQFGGVVVILFGLVLLDVIRIPFLSREHRIVRLASRQGGGGYAHAFALGAAFAAGWTPCIGPVLGAILTLAASSAGASAGALLLGVFALGLSVPFLAAAAALGSAERVIRRAGPYLGVISRVSGVLLVLMGVMVLTGQEAVFSAYMYKAFSFLNYGAIMRYF